MDSMLVDKPSRSIAPSDHSANVACNDRDGTVDQTLSSHSSHQSELAQPCTEQIASVQNEFLSLAVLCSSQLLTQSGLALSIVPQHIIARSFGIENQPGKLSWFTAGYSLTVGTFILIAGRLGDIFGHKRFLVGGFVWFGLWSALAGLAVYGGPVFFAFCRAMQGIGPAFLLPNAIAIIARCYDPGRRQNIIFGLFGATAPGGFFVGAIFASLLSERVWWPWAFWIMSFACLISALVATLVLPVTSQPGNLEQSESSIWQRVDVYGSLLGVTGLVLFNFAWNQGPVVGWQKPYTYITMTVGIALFFVFIIVETRVHHPLVPFDILKIDSIFTLICISAGWSSFGIFAFYALDFLETQRGLSPVLTSTQFAPIAISGLCAAVVTGTALSYLRASTVMLTAMIAFVTGGIILATMPVHQNYFAQTFVGIIILPWGMDMSFPAATIILSRAMPREQQGLAASLVNTFVNYSISIGLGLAGTVNVYVNEGGRDVLRGYRGVFYTGVGLAGLGVLLALIFCYVEHHRSRISKKVAQEPCQP